MLAMLASATSMQTSPSLTRLQSRELIGPACQMGHQCRKAVMRLPRPGRRLEPDSHLAFPHDTHQYAKDVRIFLGVHNDGLHRLVGRFQTNTALFTKIAL